jgi:hypothetical protein
MLAVRAGEVLEIASVQFRVAAPPTDPGADLALGLSLDPNGAVFRRFRLNNYDAQGVMSTPAVIPDFDVSHHILRSAFGATSFFHAVTP